MYYVGVDIGINNNACVTINDQLEVVKYQHQDLSKVKDICKKLYQLDTLINLYLMEYKTDDHLIVYEHPVMRGKVGANLNAVVGLLRKNVYSVFEDNYNLKAVSPNTLKKFITGSGVANKKDMLHHIKQKISIPFSTSNDHLVDALCCAYYGNDTYDTN